MKRSVNYTLHFVYWVSVFLIGDSISTALAYSIVNKEISSVLLPGLASFGIHLCIFYLSYYLSPWITGKRFRTLITICIIAVSLISIPLIFNLFFPSNSMLLVAFIAISVQIISFLIIGFLFRSLRELYFERKIKAELEKENLEIKLELLHAQINPHFLFNTLNNIDVLIEDDPDRASEFLKKLSEILRYMLYETSSDTVPLSQEIDYIKQYLDLQKIRTTNSRYVNFTVTGDSEKRNIAPLVFMPFIENAFKFASNKKVENAITIVIDILDEKIKFTCRNIVETKNQPGIKSGGLGKELINNRLKLLFDKEYNLEIKEKDNCYIVDLEINR